jgi:hypothetical protein
MYWEDLLRTLGGTAILVAAMAWLSRSLLGTLLSKDLERFKAELQASSLQSVESFKASLQIEAHRRAVEYTALHAKRAELISELYAQAVDLYDGTLGLSYELGARKARAEQYNQHEAENAKPWDFREGIHTLLPDEETKAKALHEVYKEFMLFYQARKIYFSGEVCSLIESFANLAGYMGVMYQNVAIRADENQLYVNPLVLETWNKAGEQVPKLLATLENVQVAARSRACAGQSGFTLGSIHDYALRYSCNCSTIYLSKRSR